jgi:anti-anti-sigma factor
MSDQTTSDLLDVGEVRGVTVVRFKRRTILDPQLIENLGLRLLALVREQGCLRLVLDFASVESVTSAMLGSLVALYNAVNAAGGRLVFAAVDPFLLQIFRLCNLPPTIPIHLTEADAVQALAVPGQ